jgi:hypothetical protein
MKRTSLGLLVVLAALAGAAGFVLDHMLTAMGRTTFTPSLLLPVLLLLIAAASIGVAWPVARTMATSCVACISLERTSTTTRSNLPSARASRTCQSSATNWRTLGRKPSTS